jgi:hypothetical protein
MTLHFGLPTLVSKQGISHRFAALLVGVFLFAQGVVLVHDLDPAAFETDHTCEICIPASVLGGSNVAAVFDLPVVLPDHSIERVSPAIPTSAAIWRPSARDPPAPS